MTPFYFPDFDLLSKLGLKLTHMIPALIGGALAIIFGRKRPTFRDKIKAVFIVIFGAIATGYITPIILAWKPNWESVEHSIGFVVGIFGMGLIEGLLNILKKFINNPLGTLKELKEMIYPKK